MNTEKMERENAGCAARTVWRNGGHCSVMAESIRDELLAKGYEPREANLLAEMRVTDSFSCSESEMLDILCAEYARQQGRSRGGVRTAIKHEISRMSSLVSEDADAPAETNGMAK